MSEVELKKLDASQIAKELGAAPVGKTALKASASAGRKARVAEIDAQILLATKHLLRLRETLETEQKRALTRSE